MNLIRAFCTNFVLLVMVVFEVITALPQWHNSTDCRRYLIEADLKYNWFQAQHECARKNLHLVEIDAEAKNLALVTLLKSFYGNSRDLWLGANDEYNQDRNKQRPFYWSASGKPMTYSYWSNDNPDNFRNNEHCVHTWINAPDFRWNDVSCDSPHFGYICEEQSSQVTGVPMQATLRQMMVQLSRDFQELQQLQMEKLANAQNDTMKEDNDLKEVIHSIRTKLEFDITHALAQHQREIKSAMEDENKKIFKLNFEMRNAADVMSKKFYAKLEAASGILNELSLV